jgi:hypothetical protein
MRLLPLAVLALLTAPAAAQVARVEVQPDRATLIAGNQLLFKAVARDASGKELPGRRVRWQAVPADGIVVDSTGVATAFRDGPATLTATVDGVTGTAELVIEPKSPVRIEAVADQPEIVVGGSTLLRATAYTEDGEPLPRAVFTFRSSDDRVATVDPSGVVTGRGEGSAIFAVQIGDVRTEVRVQALANRVARLMVNGPVQARTGEVVRLRASAEDRRNLPVSNPAVRWSVSGEGADIGADGGFVAERPGTYLVTVVAGAVAGTHAIRVAPRTRQPPPGTPSPPTPAGVPSGPGGPVVADARSVWVDGMFAYLADPSGTLRIFSLETPRAPREVGSWRLPAREGSALPPMPRVLNDVMVRDGLAFLAYGRDGLVILDVGQGTRGGSPSVPRIVSQLVSPRAEDLAGTVPSGAQAVLRQGRHVFVADGSRVVVVDVSNLLKPVTVAEIRLPDPGPARLWAQEDLLYIGYGAGKVQAVDIGGELRGDLVGQGR